MPLNNVVDGAPNAAAVPVCWFDVVGKQKSVAATLELLDDVLVELVLLDELTELLVLEELTELTELVELEVLTLLDTLDVVDEELLDRLLLLEALPVGTPDVELDAGSEEPPLHADTNKQKLLKMPTRLKRVRVFMIQYRDALRLRIKMFD